jgi:hypothetical protein
VNEVDGTASIEVTRSGSSTHLPLTLHVTLGGGTATSGDDYTDVSGMVNWGTNDTAAKTIDVPVANDCEIEGDETVQLTLTSLCGPATFAASATSLVATLTIHDPPMPTLSIDSAGTSMATISWTPDVPGLILQNAMSLSTSNWVNASSGPTNPANISVLAPSQFYRLICQ